jgi:hypothetical protein
MKLKLFIDRPILAGVISVLILMLWIIGSTQLPIEQFPSIAPPTISVSTSYMGASAETVMKSVIVPLEEAINGVENMLYMTSNATNTGGGNITRYERPAELVNNALYRDIPAADTASLASLKWNELFTDTLLQGWIAKGLEQNFDLRAAQLKVEEAQAQLTRLSLRSSPRWALQPMLEPLATPGRLWPRA